jgi:hypothetical protein
LEGTLCYSKVVEAVVPVAKAEPVVNVKVEVEVEVHLEVTRNRSSCQPSNSPET